MAGLASLLGGGDDDLFLGAEDDEFGSLAPARRAAAAPRSPDAANFRA
jgi:hypothetical protein